MQEKLSEEVDAIHKPNRTATNLVKFNCIVAQKRQHKQLYLPTQSANNNDILFPKMLIILYCHQQCKKSANLQITRPSSIHHSHSNNDNPHINCIQAPVQSSGKQIICKSAKCYEHHLLNPAIKIHDAKEYQSYFHNP